MKHVFLTAVTVGVFFLQDLVVGLFPLLQSVNMVLIAVILMTLILGFKYGAYYMALAAVLMSSMSFLGLLSFLIIFSIVYASVIVLQRFVFSDFSLYSTVIITAVATIVLYMLVYGISILRAVVLSHEVRIFLTSGYISEMMTSTALNALAVAIVFIILSSVSKTLNLAFLKS